MDLNKEKHRININNYSFQEYCLYFHQYNNKILCIETSMGIIEVNSAINQDLLLGGAEENSDETLKTFLKLLGAAKGK